MNHDIRVRFWQACAIFALVAGGGADVVSGFENEDSIGEVDKTLVEPVDARPRKLVLRGEQLSLIENRTFDRSTFDEILRIKLDDFVAKFGLTEAQKKKLKLAAHNDVTRFERDVDQLVGAMEAAREPAVRRQLKLELDRVVQNLVRLHEVGSFFSKALPRVLTAEQMNQFREEVAARAALHHRSNIETALRAIERKVILTVPQFDSLVALLLKEIPLPEKPGEFDDAIVQVLFARIPDFKLTPIFDEAQWPIAREILDNFREREYSLIEQGLIAEEPADAQQAENQSRQPNPDQPATKKEG